MPETADRAIKVASLSELSAKYSKSISYAPVVLKTDISQFYASIYTHSISWSRHGRDIAKADTSEKSKDIYFNELDFHVRNCQSAQTRGLIIGPDGFRLVAEYISCGIDEMLRREAGDLIVGAVRHVDDYYVGVRSQADAAIVLSRLRELLSLYELQINDTKTRIFSSLEPINDLWAQTIRDSLSDLNSWSLKNERVEFILDSALDQARLLNSDSPVKMILRGLDAMRIYSHPSWKFAEGYLQRCLHYHPHAIDYVCLLVVKRNTIDQTLDYDGWKRVSEHLIKSHIPHRNHHEIIWLLWMMLCCEIDVNDDLVAELIKMENAHIDALLVQAFVDGRLDRRPKLKFSRRLATTDSNWLLNIVARSSGFTKSAFGGAMSDEFEHLATKKIRLIDLQGSIKPFQSKKSSAISRTRYGYDDIDDSDAPDDEDWGI